MPSFRRYHWVIAKTVFCYSVTNLVIRDPIVLVIKVFVDNSQYILGLWVTCNTRTQDFSDTLLHLKRHIDTLIFDVGNSLSRFNGDNTSLTVVAD